MVGLVSLSGKGHNLPTLNTQRGLKRKTGPIFMSPYSSIPAKRVSWKPQSQPLLAILVVPNSNWNFPPMRAPNSAVKKRLAHSPAEAPARRLTNSRDSARLMALSSSISSSILTLPPCCPPPGLSSPGLSSPGTSPGLSPPGTSPPGCCSSSFSG